eukprot:Cvel_23568.t1-p1 / transcript=Cvel_23568.t1 / gene=Cvel_23568 / organism=Chromera_velia_CCMP2878 / gene_product=Signal recognition particle receptor subunit beta, putative / transcript_product=Signal recognition particle receptor subunit beta, putative / location=Cvel_scaffold2444:171-2776(-) / protein_length=237 / sequence_SO=supercontig / SO=protein_coding / is_pseudo=false
MSDPVHALTTGHLFSVVKSLFGVVGIEAGDNAVSLFLTAVVALLILLLLQVCVFSGGGRRKKGRAVVMLGPNGAGKTTLFYLLRNEKVLDTVSSLSENRDKLLLLPGQKEKAPSEGREGQKGKEKEGLELIDWPGHGRLRSSGIDLIKSARCLVFVVDAADRKSTKTAAEFLFEIFTNPDYNALKPSMLICCNKKDLREARGEEQIRADLEREIDALRTSRAATLEGQDEADSALGV